MEKKKISEHIIETDVLVIGGGIAGCFAAIKATEKGVNVILIDKGYVSKAGQSPWASSIAIFNPEWGHNLDAWMNQVSILGEYLNNRTFTEIMFKDSYARYQDLVSWGAKFQKDEDSPRPHKLRIRYFPANGAVTEALYYVGEPPYDYAQIMRNQAVKSGVKIMDKIMATDLIKQNGRVVGAIGIPTDSYDLYIFKAEATVISAGNASFKTATGARAQGLTADGHAMAYRIGAEIAGKEFIDTGTHSVPRMLRSSQHRAPSRGGRRAMINAEGDEVTSPFPAHHVSLEYDVHAGRAPIFMKVGEDRRATIYGGAMCGSSNHITDGIWPINTKCESSVPGLYSAGDSCGTYPIGAVYPGVGFSTAFCSATGARAGMAAAEYALQTEKVTLDEEELARLKKITHNPLERKGGFSPAWVTQVLQSIVIPYYVLYIKHEKRLKAALTQIEFLRDHIVPKLFARDPHELRLTHETRSMVLNAEMKLRSSLFRTESRGNHYREDYPGRDDPNWLAWVILKEENGRMKLRKEPIPKEWWPDLSKPYEEKYPYRFPEEKIN